MPEITFKSDWLKANNNVKQGDYIRFLDAGQQDKDGVWIFQVGVIQDSNVVETKKFSLNKKNYAAISKRYGTNSDKWVGKEMRVSIIKVENPKTGEMVPAIRLTAPGMVEQGLEDEAEDESPF